MPKQTDMEIIPAIDFFRHRGQSQTVNLSGARVSLTLKIFPSKIEIIRDFLEICAKSAMVIGLREIDKPTWQCKQQLELVCQKNDNFLCMQTHIVLSMSIVLEKVIIL